MKPFTRTEKILLLAVALSVAVAILIPVASFLAGKEARVRNCENNREGLHVLVIELGESFGYGADHPDVIDLDKRVQEEVKECH